MFSTYCAPIKVIVKSDMLKEIPLIRKLLHSDLPDLMRLKNQVNWNQTQSDGQFLIQGENNINFVLELENTIIGSVTGINYNNQLAWIGMMLIDKEYRGQGLSKLLLNKVINELEHCNCIKLDATPSGYPIYEKFAFKSENKIWRWTNPNVDKPTTRYKYRIEVVTHRNIKEIASFDASVFGVNRMDLLSYLRENSGALAKVVMVMDEEEVLGFMMGRQGTNYTQIGPLSAISDEVAIALLEASLLQLIGTAVVVDVLDDKEVISTYLKQNGFTKQRPLERMYFQDCTCPGVIENYYLIAGPEFG